MAVRDRNAGFVLLHRSIREHWLWHDPIKLKWWLDIIMECNHDDRKVPLGFQLIECKRGQSVNSQMTWAKRWRTSRGTVQKFLSMLKVDSMIEIENLQFTIRVTVCNYSTYNDMQAPSKHHRSTKQAPGEQQSGNEVAQTKNELKNEERSIGASAPPYRKMTEKEFYDAIAAFKDDYPKDMLRAFYDYWRESSPDGRMLFQLKKTWDLKLRLKRWQSNNLPGLKKKPEQQIPSAPPLQTLQTL